MLLLIYLLSCLFPSITGVSIDINVSDTSFLNSSILNRYFPSSYILNQNSTTIIGIVHENNSVAVYFQIENSTFINITRISWPFLSIKQEKSFIVLPKKIQDIINIFLNIDDATWINSSNLPSALSITQQSYVNVSAEKKADSISVLFNIENITWINVSKIVFNQNIIFVREESNISILIQTTPSIQVFFSIMDITWFNASKIQFAPDAIFVRQTENVSIEVQRTPELSLYFTIQNISQLQFTVLEFIRSIGGNVTGESNKYDVDVQFMCTKGEYFNNTSQFCQKCSSAPFDHYIATQCTNMNDTEYLPCRKCSFQEFEQCPCNIPSTACPSGNRICYFYPTWNITSGWIFTSSLNESVLWTYIQHVLVFMKEETQSQSVYVSTIESIQLNPYFYKYNISFSIVNLWKIPLQQNAIDHQYIIPDFTPTIEKSSYQADMMQQQSRRFLLPAPDFKLVFNYKAPMMQQQSRRFLLQAPDFNCSSNYYLHFYNGLGYQCVPCMFDPVSGTVNPNTPGYMVNLWTYSNTPCQSNQARICLGGTYQPSCITRQGIWNITNSTPVIITAPTCPVGFSLYSQSDIIICVPLPCDLGKTGQPGDCSVCIAGTYKNVIGPSPCQPCSSGTYSTALGLTSTNLCLKCKNYSTSPAGSTNPNACVCIPGSYMYITSCIQCLGGSYTNTQNELLCHICPKGTYSTQGSSTCTSCLRGYYSSSSQSTTCSPCPSNYFTNETGSTVCFMCVPGTGFTPQKYTCEDCLPGWYSYMGACLACYYGYYSTGKSMTNASTCLTCEPGLFAYTLGSTTCSGCIPGTYGLGCSKCKPGSYQTSFGALTCTECLIGTYSSEWGQSHESSCQNCYEGTYWINSSTCVKCPKNTISPPASIKLTDCSATPGFYSFPGEEGNICPENYYCPMGTTDPAKCADDMVSLPGSSVCYYPSTNVILFDWIVAVCWLIIFSLIVGCYLRHRIMLIALWRHQSTPSVKREIRIKIFQ